MDPRRASQKSFKRPDTLAPAAQVYRMINATGMPGGHQPHFHPDTVEVCFVSHGRLDWWIGRDTFELHSGDVVVMPPGVPHGSIDANLQPCEYSALHFDVAGFRELESAIRDPLFGGRYPGRPDIGEHIVRIFNEHEIRDEFSEETCWAHSKLLVVALQRDRIRNGNANVSGFVKRAQSLLREAECQPNSVSVVAEALSISTVWLNRRFQDELKVSPGEWQRSQRIAEAKRLLCSDSSGTEVALILGFRSSQYFATAFRRETGVSPSEFQRANGSNQPVVEAKI